MDLATPGDTLRVMSLFFMPGPQPSLIPAIPPKPRPAHAFAVPPGLYLHVLVISQLRRAGSAGAAFGQPSNTAWAGAQFVAGTHRVSTRLDQPGTDLPQEQICHLEHHPAMSYYP